MIDPEEQILFDQISALFDWSGFETTELGDLVTASQPGSPLASEASAVQALSATLKGFLGVIVASTPTLDNLHSAASLVGGYMTHPATIALALEAFQGLDDLAALTAWSSWHEVGADLLAASEALFPPVEPDTSVPPAFTPFPPGVDIALFNGYLDNQLDIARQWEAARLPPELPLLTSVVKSWLTEYDTLRNAPVVPTPVVEAVQADKKISDIIAILRGLGSDIALQSLDLVDL